MNFSHFAIHYQQKSQQLLTNILPPSQVTDDPLVQAMHYAVLNGGKRLRPLLIYATAQALQLDESLCDAAVCAVEIIHAYSLIHDDLPAMDNDDLRRGLPTCHKAFGEATAILAGDALQTLAFELLAQQSSISAQQRVAMIIELAKASGVHGMAGGQALDLAATNQKISLEKLLLIYELKTARLLRVCVRLACILAQVEHAPVAAALDRYADGIGIAFQIQDDILDIETHTARLGKTQGADIALAKSTYPSLTGLSAAKAYVQQQYQKAIYELTEFGSEADNLRSLASYIVNRDY